MKIDSISSIQGKHMMKFGIIVFSLLLVLKVAVFADYEKIPGAMIAPNNLDSTKIPLYVLMSFNDNRYTDAVNWVVDSLFGNLTNPAGSGNKATYDGAPIKTTFYVIGNSDSVFNNSNFEITKSWKKAFDHGHEVGNHSWSHNFNYSELNESDLFNEMSNCNRQLVNIAGLPHVNIFGHTTPFLAYTNDETGFQMLNSLGILYDASMDNGVQGSQQTWARPYFPGTMEDGFGMFNTNQKSAGLWQIPHGHLCSTPTGNFTNKAYDSDPQLGWPNSDVSDTDFVNYHKYVIDFHYSRNRAPLNINFHSDYYSEENDATAPQNTWSVSLAKRRQALKDIVAYLLSLPDVRIVTGMDVIRWMRNPVELTDLSRNDELTFKTDNGSGVISQGADTTDSNGSTVSNNSNTITVSVVDSLNGLTDGFAGQYYEFSKVLTGAHSVRITYNSNIPLNFILNQNNLGDYSYRFGLASTNGNDTTVEVPIIADYFMQPRPVDTTYRLPLDVSMVSSVSLVATALDTTLPGTFTGSFEVFGAGPLIESPKYVLTVNNGTGDGEFVQGHSADIVADDPATGKRFIGWSGDTAHVDSPSIQATKVIMPAESVTVTAEYQDIEYLLIVVNGSGGGNYIMGSEVPVVAENPPANHIFNGWSGDTAYVDSTNKMSIIVTMPAESISIKAQYLDTTKQKYVLTVNSGQGSGNFVENDTAIIIANIAEEGKEFVGWSGDTSYVIDPFLDSVGLIMPSESVTVTAEYTDIYYKLTVTNGTNSGDYIFGAEVSVSADAPPLNHIFNGWSGDVSCIDSVNKMDITVTMPAESISIEALYLDTSKPTYTLVVNSGSGDGAYNEGDSIDIIADAAEEGKQFLKWSGDTIYINNIYSDTAKICIPDSNISVTALYEDKKFQLKVFSGTGSGNYVKGSNVTVKANTPQPDNIFNGWTGDISYLDNSSAESTFVTMPEKDISIEASYLDTTKDNTDLIVINGSGSGTYNSGDSIIISANNPETGKKFSGWTGAVNYIKNIDSSTTKIFIPDTNISVTATYTDILYVLTVKNGTGSGSYKSGATIDIVGAKADSGKMFDKWIGDTASIQNVDSISTTITMPDSAVTVTATYKDIEYIIAGDFNGDSVVNSLDFSYVSTYWTRTKQGKSDSIVELAPSIGELPYLAVNPNGVFDFEDLSIFTSACYWYFENRSNLGNNRIYESFNTDGIKIKASITDQGVIITLSVDSIDNLVAVDLKLISNNKKIYFVNSSGGSLLMKDDAQVLKVNNKSSLGVIHSVMSRLSSTNVAASGSGEIAKLILDPNISDQNFIVEYKLINNEHKVIAAGRERITVRPDNDKFSQVTEAQITVVPNPYLINGSGKVGIHKVNDQQIANGQIIDVKLPQGYSLISLAIHDYSGNLIALNDDTEVISFDGNSIRYKWYGMNLNNRFVGNGTYYLFVKFKTESGDIITVKKTVNIKR